MIFSNKIYKLEDGINISLFPSDSNTIEFYLLNNSLKKYSILLNQRNNCIFEKEYNYSKLIKLNQSAICPCLNGYITLTNNGSIQ